MVKAGATVGKFIRKVRLSETWQGFQRMSRSLRTLPEDLARQTGLDEIRKDITGGAKLNQYEASPKGQKSDQDLNAWTQTPQDFEHKIRFESRKGKEKKSKSSEIDQES